MAAADNNKSAIFRIAGAGASVAFGVMMASIFATHHGPNGFSFRLNVLAVLAFIVAAPVAWFYWQMVAAMATNPDARERNRKKFKVFSAALIVTGFLSFLYPLRFVPAEKRMDVFAGLALAFGVLSGVGFVMLKLRGFLEADLKRTEAGEDRR